MKRARLLFAGCCVMSLAGAVLPAHARATASATLAPGYKPLANTDEGGLWHQADEGERLIQQSPALVRDETLNAYVRNLVCTLAGPQCATMRVYVVDMPLFNAFCAPNGMMVVWTGLLLRAQNEAQLAFVLGHEMTHYLKRHSLRAFETQRDISDVLAFLSIGLAGAGLGAGFNLGPAANLAQLIAVGAYFSYSRDNESEADAGGFELAVSHGYDPRQGAIIWQNIEDEEASNPRRKYRSLFYADHPTNKTRIAAMTKSANAMELSAHSENLGVDSYRNAVLSHRAEWLQEEINRAQYGESLFVINRLLKDEQAPGLLRYYIAEAYRRRNAKGDGELAMAAYRAAIESAGVPVAAYRGLGLVALKAGRKDTARDAFQKYLELAPEAGDRATVQYYLTSMGAAK